MRPLDGIKVIEMAGLAPSPYCGMLLADFGADVVIVDRLLKHSPEMPGHMSKNPLDRGKRSMRVNVKSPEGREIIMRMIDHSDILIEPYRPGVMEALHLGPEESLSRNERLIYARLTGWGQTGPYAGMAGHDMNYIALSGALSLFKRKGQRPLPPGNILGDFAGGGMLCAMGILLALVERNVSGKGQVVDAAMVDGAANLSTLFFGLFGNQLMTLDIGSNLLDGGAPFYQVYETSDGKFVSVGAIETKFYALFIQGLNIAPASLPHQYDMGKWPEMTERFATVFKTKTRDQWAEIFDGKDACVAPVLNIDEAADHPHNKERKLIIDVDGIPQPSPAPRLSRTPGIAEGQKGTRGGNTKEVLAEMGYSEDEITEYFQMEAVE